MVTGLVTETEDTLLIVKGDVKGEALISVGLSLESVVGKGHRGLRSVKDYALAVNLKRESTAGKSLAVKGSALTFAALAKNVVLGKEALRVLTVCGNTHSEDACLDCTELKMSISCFNIIHYR